MNLTLKDQERGNVYSTRGVSVGDGTDVHVCVVQVGLGVYGRSKDDKLTNGSMEQQVVQVMA